MPSFKPNSGSSPLTTKGDLYTNTGSADARFPAGTDGLFLKADSSQTTGLSWSAGGSLVVQSKTTTYLILNTDDVVFCDASGGAFTVTMPAAAGNTGKLIRIQKTDSSINAITISGPSKSLATQNEIRTFVSNGTSWVLVQWDPNSDWAAYTPTFQGFGTVTSIAYYWRRVYENIEVMGTAVAGTPTAVENQIGIPSGFVSSTAKIPAAMLACGQYQRSAANTEVYTTIVAPTVSYINVSRSGVGDYSKEAGGGLLGAGETFGIISTFPISGWGR